MKNLHGFPFFEMEFKKDGTIGDDNEKGKIVKEIADSNIKKLIVISHGWNNDMKEAKEMYDEIVGYVAELFKAKADAGECGILGIYWPSKKFADKELIPGGGAAGVNDVSQEDAFESQIKHLKELLDNPAKAEILDKIQFYFQNQDAVPVREKEVLDGLDELLSSFLQPSAGMLEDEGTSIEKLDITDIITRLDSNEDMAKINSGGAAAIPSLSNVGGQDAAMGIGDWLKGLKGSVQNMLNLFTYYEMKDRSGIVGVKGLNPVLREIQTKNPSVELHLIGHSFGARLVTSAIAGESSRNALTVQSLILLQAAFSHFGFAENYKDNKNGLFRRIIENQNVQGPIVITHTRHDTAVGFAYAIASRIARQAGSALGDRDDFYGGLGSNGAQKTPGSINQIALENKLSYIFNDHKIYNIKADNIIGGHSLIRNPAVAQIIVDVVTK